MEELGVNPWGKSCLPADMLTRPLWVAGKEGATWSPVCWPAANLAGAGSPTAMH